MSLHTYGARDRDIEAFDSGNDHGLESWLPLLPAAQLYPVGTVLVRQGCEPSDIFLIDEGLTKLVRIDGNGREQILGLRGPGWILGAAFVLVGRSHPASVVAVTACSLRRLSREAFLEMMAEQPGLSWHVHKMHSREVLSQFHHMADLGVKTARQRLERVLRRLVAVTSPDHNGKEVRLLSPLKRWELASLIAVTPEHLSRLLRQLRNDGIIRVQKGWIVIPDIERLAADDTEGFGVLTTPVMTDRRGMVHLFS
jgi:CRP/FNR family transcriptional regulator